VDEAVRARVRGGFPAGILVVNLTGSFALGLVVGLGAHGDALRLAGIGLLGGYTTYSAWMVDSDRLPARLAAANLAVSLAGGLLAVWLGRALG
jgi:CrcB protein